MDEDPDFNATPDIEELIKRQVKAFAAWCENNWRMDDRDRSEWGKSEEYMAGHNAAVASIKDAVESYTGDLWG